MLPLSLQYQWCDEDAAAVSAVSVVWRGRCLCLCSVSGATRMLPLSLSLSVSLSLSLQYHWCDKDAATVSAVSVVRRGCCLFLSLSLCSIIGATRTLPLSLQYHWCDEDAAAVSAVSVVRRGRCHSGISSGLSECNYTEYFLPLTRQLFSAQAVTYIDFWYWELTFSSRSFWTLTSPRLRSVFVWNL